MNQAYEMGPEKRGELGLKAREWVTSEESMMSAKMMCKNVIDSIDETISSFKPKKTFELIKVEKIKRKANLHNLTY
jgi:hypothetical protein